MSPSRTSPTDEAAERCRLHGRRPLSLEAARDGAFFHLNFAQNNANLLRKHAQNDAFGHPSLYVVPRSTPTTGPIGGSSAAEQHAATSNVNVNERRFCMFRARNDVSNCSVKQFMTYFETGHSENSSQSATTARRTREQPREKMWLRRPGST